MSYLLHLEGMDLAGKSTIARIICEEGKKNWTVNDKQLTPNNDIYDFAWNKGKTHEYSSEIMGYMYLAALLSDIERFNLDKDIIQDSLLALRSLNYYTIVKPNTELEHLYQTVLQRHPMPDKSFYLTANIETRQKRLAKRIASNPIKITNMDMMIKDNPLLFEKIDNSLNEISVKYFNSIIIDTSKMTEIEVFNVISSMCDFTV